MSQSTGDTRSLRVTRTRIVLAVAGALFVSAVVPTGDAVARHGPLGVLTLDLWLHAVGYGLLAGVSLWATEQRGWRPVWTRALLVTAYGVVLEGVQAFLPYRHYSGVDVLANVTGVVVAVCCYLAFERSSR